MIVLKYFHEEPASLEMLSDDDDPDSRRQSTDLSLEDFLRQKQYFRGYLTATSLEDRTFGLTRLPLSAFTELMRDILKGRTVRSWLRTGDERAFDAADVLERIDELRAIVAGEGRPRAFPGERFESDDRRRSVPALRSMLDAGLVVLFPEPAHDGVDLSIFSSTPLRPAIETALKSRVAVDLRAFSIPHREARSEEKFYFELYDLERYRACEITKA